MSAATPNKYANGRIYRIVCGDLTYIGSTCQQLSKRISDHRKTYKMWAKDPSKYGNMSSFRLFEVGEPEIFLIEDYPCERNEQLLARERHYIETLECVNKNIPGRTEKETWAAYYQANKDHIRERDRDYKREYMRKYRNTPVESYKIL